MEVAWAASPGFILRGTVPRARSGTAGALRPRSGRRARPWSRQNAGEQHGAGVGVAVAPPQAAASAARGAAVAREWLAPAAAAGALCAAASRIAAQRRLRVVQACRVLRRSRAAVRAECGAAAASAADAGQRAIVTHALAALIAVATPSVADASAVAAPAAEVPGVEAAVRPVEGVQEVDGTYLQLLELVDEGTVHRIDIFDEGKTAVTHLDNQGVSEDLVVGLPGTGTTPEFIDKLQQRSVKINVHAHEDELSDMDVMLFIAIQFAIPFLLTGTLLWVTQRGLSLTRKSKAEVQVMPKTGVTFGQVAGIDEAKEEMCEVIDFFRTPERFVRVGARIPRGVMLTGPPGTGKTLMAKALAGEAGVPFIQANAAEFVELFVGVGAARVRDIFQRAREHAPCIVFVDEVDAIGGARSRGPNDSRGAAEREQTLNQLLTEMDGFDGDGGVIVVAATNRFETLDKAMLRPGRFDRHITIGLPDVNGRAEILRVHAADKRLAEGVSLAEVARRTSGFSGAQLGNLMNEAAILAARRQQQHMTKLEIEDALDRVTAGIQGAPLADSATKRIIAYYEAGHALIGTLLPHHDHVHKVTLIPRGQTKGSTAFLPAEDESLVSRSALQAQITGALGGRAAERVVFGSHRVTSGAHGDLQQVETLARAMVTTFGMSSVGTVAIDDGGFLGPAYSDQLADAIDGAVQQISDECFGTALDLLTEHRACLDRIVGELVEHETLTGTRLREIIAEFTEVPPRLSLGS